MVQNMMKKFGNNPIGIHSKELPKFAKEKA